ncbi:hypothetical protein D3C80_722200 [compost metagenome]
MRHMCSKGTHIFAAIDKFAGEIQKALGQSCDFARAVAFKRPDRGSPALGNLVRSHNQRIDRAGNVSIENIGNR